MELFSLSDGFLPSPKDVPPRLASLCSLTSGMLTLPKLQYLFSPLHSSYIKNTHYSMSNGNSGYLSHIPVSSHLASCTKNPSIYQRSCILAGKSDPKVSTEGRHSQKHPRKSLTSPIKHHTCTLVFITH